MPTSESGQDRHKWRVRSMVQFNLPGTSSATSAAARTPGSYLSTHEPCRVYSLPAEHSSTRHSHQIDFPALAVPPCPREQWRRMVALKPPAGRRHLGRRGLGRRGDGLSRALCRPAHGAPHEPDHTADLAGARAHLQAQQAAVSRVVINPTPQARR